MKFEILDKAVGKARPRWNGYKMYTPTKTSNFEEKVKYAYLSKYNIKRDPTEKPIKITIECIFTPPESMSNKKKSELYGELYCKKPDIDNIAKSVLDGLNKIAYKDDNQVAILDVIKKYGTENKVIVELEEIC